MEELCTTALQNLLKKMRNTYCISVNLDSKKSLEITYVNSLNTVNTRHQILFAKLEHFGICGAALQWIKSHFARRI